MNIINLTLIFIIIIITLFIIINKKYIIDNFKNLNDLESDIEAAKKASLDKIEYRTGKKGLPGLRGDIGDKGQDGVLGNIGNRGDDGIESGPIIFQDKNGIELGRYQPDGEAANNEKLYINVPDGIKGIEGLVGPIIFVKEDVNIDSKIDYNIDNKEVNIPISSYSNDDILGTYFPPDDTEASKIKPIIIKVPNGLEGNVGITAACSKCEKGDKGPDGKPGIQGEPGEVGNTGNKGKDGINGGEKEKSVFEDIKINNKICWKKNENNICLTNDLLNAIIFDLNDKKNNKKYIPPLKRRENRIKNELCTTKPNNHKYNILINDLYETMKIENPDIDISNVFSSSDC
jgi:hypothetical protein